MTKSFQLSDFKVGDQIKVRTKTDRHNAAGRWHTITSVGRSKLNTAEYRIPVSLVTNHKPADPSNPVTETVIVQKVACIGDSVKVGDQIQVETKTHRHQLYNVWMTVKSAKPGSVSVTTDNNWRIWRNQIIKVK